MSPADATTSTSNSNTINPAIKKLTGADKYSQWSYFMEIYLKGEGLWKITNGMEKRPADTVREAPATAATDAGAATPRVRDNAEAVEKWEMKDAKAMTKILACVDESLFTKWRQHDTAAALWSGIKKSYEELSSQNILLWWLELTQAALEEGNSLQPHFDRILEANRKLTNAKFTIPEPILAIIILTSLPESYSTLVSTLHTNLTAASGEERTSTFTSEFVINRLLEYEKLQSIRETSGGAALAAFKRQDAKKKQSGNSDKDKDKDKDNRERCSNCRRRNHTFDDCRRPGGPKWKPKDPKESSKANVATTTNITYDSDEESALMAVASIPNAKQTDWIIDSGATTHLCADQKAFSDYVFTNQNVHIGDNSKLRAFGSGTIPIPNSASDDPSVFHLRSALHVPELAFNLMSVSKLTAYGNLTFTEHGCYLISHNGEPLLNGVCRDGLYYLSKPLEKKAMVTALVASTNSQPTEIDIDLGHRRMGHLNVKAIRMLSKGDIAKGFRVKAGDMPDCEGCAIGKSRRNPMPKMTTTKPSRPLELVFADLVGPITPLTPGKAKYALEIVCGCSFYQWQHLLGSKDEAAEAFSKWLEKVELETGYKLGTIRTDNGTEFTGSEFREALIKGKVQLQLTAPYAHHQIGVVERSHQTVFNRTRAVMHANNLPKNLWGEISTAIVYLKNRSPTSALDGRTPSEALNKKIPNLKRLRALGCEAYAHRPKEKCKGKLDARSTKGIFVGYDKNSPAYRIWDGHKIIRSNDVTFFEKKGIEERVIIELPSTETSQSSTKPPNSPKPPSPSSQQTLSPLTPLPSITVTEPENLQLPPLRRSGRTHEVVPPQEKWEKERERVSSLKVGDNSGQNSTTKQLAQVATHPSSSYLDEIDEIETRIEYLVHAHAFLAKTSINGDPKSWAEAMRRPDREEWRRAGAEEVAALEKNQTWVLVPPPPGVKIHNGIWVLITKYDKYGRPIRKKARYVFNGSTQRWDLGHFDRTSSPVIRITSLRILVTHAAHNRWNIHQMDFDNAYLNGKIDVELYMRQPPGFEKPGMEDWVCRLLRSLYGLKQAGQIWNEILHQALLEIGFIRLSVESCLYRLHVPEKGIDIFIGIYVDDAALTGTPQSEVDRVKVELNKRFSMRDMGVASYLLGIAIDYSPDGRFIELSQIQFLKDILKRFGYENVKPSTTPMDVEFPTQALLHVASDDTDKVKYPYREAVGSLMYPAICTCPDLSFAVSVLSQYNSSYTAFHWEKGIVRVFRYLKYRIEKRYVLRYDGDEDDYPVLGYSDSDWAGDRKTRRSTTGYVYKMAGAAVSWKTRKQQTVAMSTNESEYMALGDATKEALWLRSLLTEMSVIRRGYPIRINCDNEGCIHLAENPLLSDRSKHIDIRHHFVRDEILRESIYLSYCPTSDMTADIFTKALERIKHSHFVHSLGIRSSASSGGST